MTDRHLDQPLVQPSHVLEPSQDPSEETPSIDGSFQSECDFLADRLQVPRVCVAGSEASSFDSHAVYRSRDGSNPPNPAEVLAPVLERGAGVFVHDASEAGRIPEIGGLLEDYGVRAYAGLPLRLPDESVAGVLCVMDTEPHSFSPSDRDLLRFVRDRIQEKQTLLQRVSSLEKRDRQFHELTTHLNNVHYMYDPEFSELLYLSPSAEEVWGMDQERLMESPGNYLEAVHPEDRDRVKSRKKSFRQDPSEQSVELTFRLLRDGEVRWIRDSMYGIFDDRGNLKRIAGIATDITRERRLQEQLDEERAFLRTVVDSTPHFISVKDWDGIYQFVNETEADLLGMKPEDFVGQNRYDVFGDESLQEHLEDEREVMRSGEPREMPPRSFVHPRTGDELVLRIIKVPLDRDKPPERRRLLTIGIDITDLKQTQRKLEESERRFRRMAETIDQAFFFLSPDYPHYDWIYINSAFEDLYGVTLEELKDDPMAWTRHVPEQDLERIRTDLRDQADRRIKDLQVQEIRVDPPDEATRWLRVRIYPYTDDRGKLIRLIGTSTDVTRQKEARQKLEDNEQIFREIARSVSEDLWLASADRTILHYVSPSVGDRWGLSMKELYRDPTHWRTVVVEEDLARIEPDLRALEDEPVDLEFRIEPDPGERRWIRMEIFPVRNEEGEIYRYAAISEDFTERKRLEEQLKDSLEDIEHQAQHDSLTGLPNRRLLNERIREELAGLQELEDQRLVLFFLDIDQFKDINDAFGHTTGDKILVEISERLRETFGGDHLIARFGGDEFVVLLRGIQDRSEIQEQVDRLMSALEPEVRVDDRQFTVEGSLGISTVSTDDVSGDHSLSDATDTLIRNADNAMYRAKEQGEDFRFYTQDMHHQIRDFFSLRDELNRALEHEQFVPFYQPVVNVSSREIVGAEALARWNHPERGILAPGEFLEEAEKSSLVESIDRMMLRKVCEDLTRWDDQGGRDLDWVSINFSPHHFLQSDFQERLWGILAENEIESPVDIHLEILETTLMEHSQMTRENLEAVSEMGFELVLDDFGTGYASFHQLMELPINGLKIDQSFVHKAEEEEYARKVLRTSIDLGRNMDKRVIAEGTETAEQVAILEDIQCPLTQGFYFHRPLPAGEFHGLL